MLQSAAYDATSAAIVLSFNENIQSDDATIPVRGDFVVKVNSVTINDIAVTPGAKNNQVKITSQSANFNTGNITITTASSTTGSDAAGNNLAQDITVSMTR